MRVHNKIVHSNTTPSDTTPSSTALTMGTPPSADNEISSNAYETAHLTITMIIQSKSRKKTAYRVAQRPDGVIVEKPRYRPSSSSPAPVNRESIFEKRSQILELPQGTSKGTQMNKEMRMSEDLRGVGGFAGGDRSIRRCGRDEYTGVFERGRGGYNEVFGRGTNGYQGPFENHVRRSDVADPMQRFLEEPGPWSTHSRRAAVISNQERA